MNARDGQLRIANLGQEGARAEAALVPNETPIELAERIFSRYSQYTKIQMYRRLPRLNSPSDLAEPQISPRGGGLMVTTIFACSLAFYAGQQVPARLNVSFPPKPAFSLVQVHAECLSWLKGGIAAFQRLWHVGLDLSRYLDFSQLNVPESVLGDLTVPIHTPFKTLGSPKGLSEGVKHPPAMGAHTYQQQLDRIDHVQRRGDFLGAIVMLRALLEQFPQSVPIFYRLGELYLQTHQVNALEALLESKEAESLAQEGLIGVLRARLWLVKGQPEEALAYISEHYQPNFEIPYKNVLAAVYQKLGQHSQASETYWRLLQLNPHEGSWWVGLGISLEALGDHANATLSYQRAAYYPLDSKLTQYIAERLDGALNGKP